METNAFKEIIFVEEEFFYSKNIKAKKVEGKINNQVFSAYVSNFDYLYDLVLKNPGISYKN